MQTWLPYSNFHDSLRCLDWLRLSYQKRQTYDLIKVITENTSGWKNHPIILMWKDYPNALKLYYNISLDAWEARGYTLKKYNEKFEINENDVEMPWWLGNEELHNSHRSVLLRRLPKYYCQFNWNVPDNLNYWWPVLFDREEKVIDNKKHVIAAHNTAYDIINTLDNTIIAKKVTYETVVVSKRIFELLKYRNYEIKVIKTF